MKAPNSSSNETAIFSMSHVSHCDANGGASLRHRDALGLFAHSATYEVKGCRAIRNNLLKSYIALA